MLPRVTCLRWAIHVRVVSLSLVACANDATAFAAGAGASGSPPQAPTASAADESRSGAVGYAGVPVAASKRSQATNKKGLDALRTGRLRDATGLFASALRDDPEYADARFNLACAQARLGDIKAAADNLRTLAARDLPDIAARIRHTPALAQLAAAPDGRALLDWMTAFRERWNTLARGGVPAILWQGRSRRTDAIIDVAFLRAGSYNHEQRCFLPLAPSVAGATAALVNLGSAGVVVANVRPAQCASDRCPQTDSVTVRTFGSPFDAERMEKPLLWSYRGGAAAGLTEVDIQTTTTGMRVFPHACDANPCRSWWRQIDRAGARRDPLQTVADQPMLAVDYRGSTLTVPLSHHTLTNGKLTGPGLEPIDLGRPHRHATSSSLVASSDGRTILVVATQDRCDDSCKSVLQHAVSIVQLATRQATLVIQGAGAAAARRDSNGAVYIQRGNAVTRWPSVEAVAGDSGEPLPPGIVLFVPRQRRPTCCSI